MVTMVTLVIIKILTLFNNPIYTGNYGNLGNSSFWGVSGACQGGQMNKTYKNPHYFGNYGNLGNHQDCSPVQQSHLYR